MADARAQDHEDGDRMSPRLDPRCWMRYPDRGPLEDHVCRSHFPETHSGTLAYNVCHRNGGTHYAKVRAAIHSHEIDDWRGCGEASLALITQITEAHA